MPTWMTSCPRHLGRPLRFATTWDPHPRHRVRVEVLGSFVVSRTGVVDTSALSVRDWLSLTGQAVLEVTTGHALRRSCPSADVRPTAETISDHAWSHHGWRAWPCTWRLLERRRAPLRQVGRHRLVHLPRGQEVAELLHRALGAGDWRIREDALVDSLRSLNRLQQDVGLPTADDPIEPFFDWPYRRVRDDVVALLEASVTDPAVRSLPRGVGSAEQWSHNVDVLVDPVRRRALPSD